MRIQHNIMAMNAYRNYNNNASALSKNLEKLSSGYKINRAGDDAAGLAISEKMRAQITGLNAASKNVKDGISLVKTAEGAMQEIQDMLNRMDYLATQSANGTYQDEVDREALQKEVNQLRDEINRIADSANFNGIKLLDGSLAAEGGTTQVDPKGFVNVETETLDATKATSTVTLADPGTGKAWSDGKTVTLNIGLSDGTSKAITLTASVDDKGVTTLTDQDGNEVGTVAVKTGTTPGDISKADLNNAFAKALEKTNLGENYKFAADATNITMTAKTAGANGITITSADQTENGTAGEAIAATKIAAVTATEGTDDITMVKLYDATAGDNALTLYDGTNADKAVFEINGQKFAIGEIDVDASKLDKDVTYIGISNGSDLNTAVDQNTVAYEIAQKTGLKVSVFTAAATDKINGGDTAVAGDVYLKFESNTTGTKANGGLTLQIGDTSDDYNQLRVSVGDMHTKALGIADLSVATREDAAAAIQTVKDAINNVSSVRGDLGAYQNRLEHTANNLSVMAENIQDAESTIRDTDVAEEMMSYVKNNILVQSAQAMLAQANQVPQGVLQLLG